MKTVQSKSNSDTTHHAVLNHGKESFFSEKAERAAPFFSPAYIQPKLKIGSPNDKYERQADRVADAVVSSPIPAIQQQSMDDEEEMLQMKCSDCEKEENVQMKSVSAGTSNTAPPGISQKIQNAGGGNHLPESVNNEMSKKMGADFSNVNIHTGSEASLLNQSLGARAFTHGSDVFFNSGEYNLGSREGKRLLAHELTHVVQQGNGSLKIQKEEGTSETRNTVTSHSINSSTEVWSGEVDRREIVPAEGSTPERTLSLLRGVRIEFDPDSCTVTLPSRLKFEHPNSSNWPRCGADHGNPIPANQLDSDTFNELKQRYIRLTNQWLNGWYKVRLNNCDENCAGQDMDIIVNVTEDPSNANTTVVLANTTGRSCANPSMVTLHARGLRGGGIMDHRLIHESGHMAIGFFDEYPVSRGNSDEESVRRGDFSAAGSSSDFQSWMQLHERHFTFVTEFMQTIFPNCNAELVEIIRPEVGFELNAILGYSNYERGGLHLDVGLDLELFPGGSRDLQLIAGAHGHILFPLNSPERIAFLIGARLGLEYTFGTSSGGAQIGAFGEFGYGTFGRSDPDNPRDSERFGSPYYMVGGSAGYSFSPSSGVIPFLNVAAGFGSTIPTGAEEIAIQNSEWFFLGLNTGFQWR